MSAVSLPWVETWLPGARAQVLSRHHAWLIAGRRGDGLAHAARALTRLGERPVEVLSAEWWAAGRATPMKRAMLGLHQELAGHSTRGRHSLVAGTDHANLPVARPDAVADAVRHNLKGWLA